MLHPSAVLSFLAAVTQTIRLGSGIILLPQRNPVVLAKELASTDVLSKGRLIFGLGVGYLKAEFDAIGVPFEHRGARADEYLEAMIALWSEEKPSYHGRYVSFSGVRAEPRPVQKPHPEVVVGGMSDSAYRRAVSRANGWYGFALDLEGTQKSLHGLERAHKEVERPAALGSLELSVTPAVPLDRDTVKRFEDLGIQRLIPMPRGRTQDQLLAFVEETANLIGA